MKNTPAPQSTKEVKQFLGLAWYCHKFVPQFSDLSRSLTRLTRKDVLFEWTKEFQACFKLLKETLCTHPILQYPDPNRPYVLLQMLVSMDGQEHSLNLTKGSMTHSTDEDSDSSPCLIHQWTFQRKSAELGCPYKGTLCYLYVHQKAQLLPHQC